MDPKHVLNCFINEIWNTGNFDNLSNYVKFPYHVKDDPGDPWNKQTLNPEDFIYRIMYSRNAFPDLHIDIQEMIREQNSVAMRWTITGTHTGDLPKLKATNKAFSLSGISIYYFQNGKLIGHSQQYDQLGFLQTVGAAL